MLWLEKEGQSIADGAVSEDGLVFGTYLHGLFDSNDFTRTLINTLRARKGLPPLDSTVDYAHYKAQQFDLLADAMRKNIDIDRIYQIMHQHQERAC
jgi:adenosylcobyric acid synthase